MSGYSGQEGWQEFLALCQSAATPVELDRILRLHLTQEEQQAVAMRYLIIRELLKGEQTQREMAKNLQVSIAKITRGSNSVKLIDDELRAQILEKVR